ncbi:hypothetical protein K438DRAFT_1956894 [Mycena galopus ATCC 62051]|nr:hypothetical protein K438DRAFT_1956894 [Mycena galopus ATCC 62051]
MASRQRGGSSGGGRRKNTNTATSGGTAEPRKRVPSSNLPAEPPRRMSRANQGQGGHVDQLECAGAIAHETTRQKRSAFQGNEVPLNEQAPAQQPAKKRVKKTNTAAAGSRTQAQERQSTIVPPPGSSQGMLPPPPMFGPTQSAPSGLTMNTFAPPPGSTAYAPTNRLPPPAAQMWAQPSQVAGYGPPPSQGRPQSQGPPSGPNPGTFIQPPPDNRNQRAPTPANFRSGPAPNQQSENPNERAPTPVNFRSGPAPDQQGYSRITPEDPGGRGWNIDTMDGMLPMDEQGLALFHELIDYEDQQEPNRHNGDTAMLKELLDHGYFQPAATPNIGRKDGHGTSNEEEEQGDRRSVDSVSPDEEERRAADFLRGGSTQTINPDLAGGHNHSELERNDLIHQRLQGQYPGQYNGFQQNPGPQYHQTQAGDSWWLPQEQPLSVPRTPTDVLEAHWGQNRPPRPPLPSHLAQTASHASQIASSSRSSSVSRVFGLACKQLRVFGLAHKQPPIFGRLAPNSVGDSDSDDSDGSSGSDNDERDGTTRAPQNSLNPPTTNNAKPSQLRFYVNFPVMTRAYVRAKRGYDAYILCIKAFPVGSQAKVQGKECLTEARVLVEADGDVLENLLLTKSGVKLVTNEGATYRGELKKYIRKQVTSMYSLYPDATSINLATGKKYTSQERREYCAKAVDELLRDGKYLKSGPGRDENLNHPIIGMSIKYALHEHGSPSLVSLFPEIVQGDRVPPQAVALIGAIVTNCLHEEMEGDTVKFTRKRYKSTYELILGMIEELMRSPTAAHFYEKQLEDWAKEPEDESSFNAPGFRIVLNL